MTNKPIKSIDDFNDALNLGLVKKTHAATSLNLHSSRSHTIFKLIIRWPVNTNDVQDSEPGYEESTLSIVDLAGSERAYRAETSGKELLQACKINKSLYVLGKCMEIMKNNSVFVMKKIVPFRESKLTMLFQEYFQGDQNIIMVTNINPCRDDFDETLRVLSYACIAKEIRPIKSKIITTNPIRYVYNNSILCLKIFPNFSFSLRVVKFLFIYSFILILNFLNNHSLEKKKKIQFMTAARPKKKMVRYRTDFFLSMTIRIRIHHHF